MTDNPSAFPSEGEGHGNPRYHSPGMTLRDWFAGQALEGLCANSSTPDQLVGLGFAGSKDMLAECAFAHADAMLSARAAIAKATPTGEGM
jgi:hypothetical protein